MGKIRTNELLTSVSHELRTPLNNTISMIKEAITAEEGNIKAQSLHRALASSNDLSLVLDTILEIPNIESGQINLSNSPFEIGKVLLDLNNLIYAQCKAKGIHWEPQFNVAGTLSLSGDRTKLTQILTIMLRNSVNQANEGKAKVSLRIDLLEETDETACLRFEVSDNSTDMTAKKLQDLTRMFEPGSDNTGLNSSEILLSVCCNIVKAMGSQVKVENKQGLNKRSTDLESGDSCLSFSVTFPKAVMAAPPAEIGKSKVGLPGKRILVVDDGPVNRKTLKNLLTKVGIETIEAADGKEAVKIYMEESKGIDLILMDVMMPVMNGYEATREIRDSGLPNAKSIPIIAITSMTFRENADAAIKAGMDFHIEKPVEPETLLSTLKRFILWEA